MEDTIPWTFPYMWRISEMDKTIDLLTAPQGMRMGRKSRSSYLPCEEP